MFWYNAGRANSPSSGFSDWFLSLVTGPSIVATTTTVPQQEEEEEEEDEEEVEFVHSLNRDKRRQWTPWRPINKLLSATNCPGFIPKVKPYLGPIDTVLTFTTNLTSSIAGEITNAISLPLEKPFYLYSLSGGGCQQVKGATLKEETVNFDKNAGRYQLNTEGENPFQMDKNGAQMKLTYCYYTPGKEN